MTLANERTNILIVRFSTTFIIEQSTEMLRQLPPHNFEGLLS